MTNAGDAIRDRDARQVGAPTEGVIPDAGNTIRNRDARQAAAPTEGIIPDAGDTVREPVIVTCLASRISMQHRLFFIEQNSIDTRIIQVPRANLNHRQAGAAIEGGIPDAGDTIRNRDARQSWSMSGHLNWQRGEAGTHRRRAQEGLGVIS